MRDKGVFIDGELWDDFWKVCREHKVSMRGFLSECVALANTDPEFADQVSLSYHDRKQKERQELIDRVNMAPAPPKL